MGFDSAFKKIWSKGRKIDPLSHKALEAIVKQDSKGVREVARVLGISGLQREADKNVDDPARGIGRAAATVGLAYGGYAALGGGSAAAGPGMSAATTGPSGSGMVLGASGGGTGAGLSTTGGTTTSLSTTGLGGGGGGFSPQFQKLMQMRQPMQQPEPYQWQDMPYEPERNPYMDEIALSSKKAKKPARSIDQAIQRGARGENPIDTNGVQMAAIKALMQRFERIESAMQQRSA